MAQLNPLPGYKFAYHLDGTFGYWTADYTLTAGYLGSAQLKQLMDGDTDVASISDTNVGNYASRWLVLVFPEPRDITAYATSHNSENDYVDLISIDISTDTNAGNDGVWANAYSGTTNSNTAQTTPWMFTNVSWSAVKGVRARYYNTVNSAMDLFVREFSLFGSYVYTGLHFWDETLDQAVTPTFFDFGDITQGQTYYRNFRIKNDDAQEAQTITVSITDAVQGQTGARISFSLDNSTWAPSIVIPSIATSAISPVIYLKREVLVTDTLGLAGHALISTTVGAWV